MRAALARLLALLAVLLVAGIAVVPARTAAETVVAGWLDCGRASGATCTVGPTLTLRSTDLGGTTVTINVSWLLDQLPTLEQDDWLIFEVEILPDGTAQATSLVPSTDGTINTGQTTGSRRVREQPEPDNDEDEPPPVQATPTTTASVTATPTGAKLADQHRDGGTPTH